LLPATQWTGVAPRSGRRRADRRPSDAPPEANRRCPARPHPTVSGASG